MIVACIGRQILSQWTSREVHASVFKVKFKFLGQFSVLLRRLETVNTCEMVTINKIVFLPAAI